MHGRLALTSEVQAWAFYRSMLVFVLGWCLVMIRLSGMLHDSTLEVDTTTRLLTSLLTSLLTFHGPPTFSYCCETPCISTEIPAVIRMKGSNSWLHLQISFRAAAIPSDRLRKKAGPMPKAGCLPFSRSSRDVRAESATTSFERYVHRRQSRILALWNVKSALQVAIKAISQDVLFAAFTPTLPNACTTPPHSHRIARSS